MATPHDDLAGQYLDALLSADRAEARRLALDALDAGMTLETLYTGVLRPVQREIGRRWQVGAATVAQEHYATAATQALMSELYGRLFGTPRRGTRLVAAAVPGCLHELGVRMLTDLFELAGWDTHYLGPCGPDALRREVAATRPAVVALSASMRGELPALRAAIQALRAEPACAGSLILVGGLALAGAPDAWRELGADGTAAEAEDAIAWAAARVPPRSGPEGPHAR